MRWRFNQGASQLEARALARVESKMQQFWSAFEERSRELEALLDGEGEFDLARFMADQLEPIDHRLTWEFGPSERGHRLVITPEADRHLRPMVARMLALAPALPHWTFLSHRPPEPLQDAERLVEARTGRRLRLDRAEVARGEHGRIDLRFVPERGARLSKDLEEQALLAAELLVGEQYLDDWIGAVGLADRSEGTASLDHLYAAVVAAIHEVQVVLPDRPYFRLRNELAWSVYQLGEVEVSEEAPGRQDLYVARTALPCLFETARIGAPFSSARFSRCGELFCYVKLDGGDCEPLDRVLAEARLDRTLAESSLGAVIGGANGRAYSYVDLALAKPERGFERTKEILRDLGAPRRSWILFFDDDLAGEWIPIWEDSPRPPGLPA
jgi:hypothetical protein